MSINTLKWLLIQQGQNLQSNSCPEKLIENIGKLVWHQDELGQLVYLLNGASLKKQIVKIPVMLDGQGADETHCGYNSFLRPYVKSELYNRLRIMEKSIINAPK